MTKFGDLLLYDDVLRWSAINLKRKTPKTVWNRIDNPMREFWPYKSTKLWIFWPNFNRLTVYQIRYESQSWGPDLYGEYTLNAAFLTLKSYPDLYGGPTYTPVYTVKAKCDQCTIDTSRTSPFNKIPLRKLSRAEDNRQRIILQRVN